MFGIGWKMEIEMGQTNDSNHIDTENKKNSFPFKKENNRRIKWYLREKVHTIIYDEHSLQHSLYS